MDKEMVPEHSIKMHPFIVQNEIPPLRRFPRRPPEPFQERHDPFKLSDVNRFDVAVAERLKPEPSRNDRDLIRQVGDHLDVIGHPLRADLGERNCHDL